MTQEALKLAEIIEHFDSNDESLPLELLKEISATLRALAQTQEPVVKLKTSNMLLRCHRCGCSDKLNIQIEYTTPPQRTEQCLGFDVVIDPSMPANTMKFVAPPQRTWVGLTEQQRKEIERQSVYIDGAIRMTEAKLKQNNNE